MNLNFPILIYTHTDVSDVWPMTFGQLEKFLPEEKIYVAVNSLSDNLSKKYTQIVYDDSLKYTDRLKQVLYSIDESTLLFLHEDMVLVGEPMFDIINAYDFYIKNKFIDSVKLIFAGNEYETPTTDETLVRNSFSKFSIQPTIISKDSFLSLLGSVESTNIWDFENKVIDNGRHYMSKLGNENKRGMYHYDSIVFPYIATAIVKGKWNISEYKFELENLFSEYHIQSELRGSV